jgi:hypothetical protein
MKSIVYLSHPFRDELLPVAVEHGDTYSPYEILKNQERFIGSRGLHYYGWRYVFSIPGNMDIHARIHARATYISRTADIRILHGRVAPPDWTDKRPVGRDYQWYVTQERIARSRFRHWKRMEKTRRGSTWNWCGYACIDWSFGLHKFNDNLNHLEREALRQRLHLAATCRRPLPSWSINTAVDRLLKAA